MSVLGREASYLPKTMETWALAPIVGDFIYHLDSLENIIQSVVADYIQVNLKGDVS
ncbi:MAG: hypothetical protein P8K27_04590 [Gammaproteobacteria bacterium]|nr:hypothetical protein [Gammaproteobacteria bacterium]